MTHLAQFWKKNKGKMTYREAMQEAKKTYKKKGGVPVAKKKAKKKVQKKKSE